MAQRPDAWLPLYIADYRADTSRFSTEQHGAYLLIIMDYWRNGPPPDDDRVLAQIAGLSAGKWKAHRPVIAQKFQITGGAWKHKRVEAELAKARGKQAALSERGKQGAEARWNKDGSGNASGDGLSMPEALPDTMPADAPSPSPSQEVLPSPAPPPSPSPVAPTASRRTRPKGANGKAKTAAVWAAYSQAYRERHGVDPTPNAKVNGQLAQFIERVPVAEAPEIAAFYVHSNRSFYVSRKHPVGSLLADAEALRTEWLTGRAGTQTEAMQADRTAATGNVFRELIEENRNAGK